MTTYRLSIPHSATGYHAGATCKVRYRGEIKDGIIARVIPCSHSPYDEAEVIVGDEVYYVSTEPLVLQVTCHQVKSDG